MNVKKILTLFEAILLFSGSVFIFVDSVINIASFGIDGLNFVNSLFYVIMCSFIFILVIASFIFYKKKDCDFILPAYDYCFNCLGVGLAINMVMYLVKYNDSYFKNNNIDSAVLYTLLALITIYFSIYGIVYKRKDLKVFKFVPYILLISCFGIYIYIYHNLFMLIGSIFLISSLLLAILTSLLKEKLNNI